MHSPTKSCIGTLALNSARSCVTPTSVVCSIELAT